jgi:hypothetical protein
MDLRVKGVSLGLDEAEEGENISEMGLHHYLKMRLFCVVKGDYQKGCTSSSLNLNSQGTCQAVST